MIQTRLGSIQTRSLHVMFVSGWRIVSRIATPRWDLIFWVLQEVYNLHINISWHRSILGVQLLSIGVSRMLMNSKYISTYMIIVLTTRLRN